MLDAMCKDMGYSEGKTKCDEVKGRLRRVRPCRGLHRGDWTIVGMWCDGKVGGGKRYRVWGAMKEGGSNVAVDRKDLGETIDGVNKAEKEDKMEELLRGPLLEPVETHVD